MTPLSGFTDPPLPPECHKLEVHRDPFLGFITHYRHTENAMQEKIGTDRIGTVSLQGTDDERRAILRAMGTGILSHCGPENRAAYFANTSERAQE